MDGTGQCRLCGAPVSSGTGEDGAFCCPGCARVWQVIQGMDASAGAGYLEAARRLGIVPSGGADPRAAPDTRVPPDPEAIREQRLAVSGMFCPSCSWVMEQVIESLEGVDAARIDFFSETGLVRYDMRRTSPDRINEILAPLGYSVGEIEEPGAGAVSRRFTFAFIACAILFMNLMSISVLRYFEQLHVPGFLHWVELALVLPVMWLGWLPIAGRALEGLRRGAVTMDVLIATAVAAAFGLSLAALVLGRPDIYFETAAGLVTISLLSRMIEARLRQRAFAEVGVLMRMQSTRVRRAEGDGRETYVRVDDVHRGDTLIFLPGEAVPFDGVVSGPELFVSEAVLTGEPLPVRKVAGDAIVAGSTVVEGGRLVLAVSRRHDETRLHGIVRSVGETLRQSESRLRSADRIAAWFTPAVLCVSVLAWVLRLALLGWDHALGAQGWFPSVAVLAVACPCAFGLAGTAAVTAATGALVRRGILVKEAGQLERLGAIRDVIFDKTGTLTEGVMQVTRIAWRDGERPDLLALVRLAEEGSIHPVAQAVRGHLEALGIEAAPGTAGRDVPGRGRVLETREGLLAVGAASLFEDAFEPDDVDASMTVSWFGLDGRAEGCFVIGDRVRSDAHDAIDGLRALGCGTRILSGDRQEVCDWLAGELGMDASSGGQSLEDKVRLVRQRRERGLRDAYCGDGTNDALAMSEATASIALPRSTDEALGASGFVLVSGAVSGVALLMQAGRRLRRVIRSNYFWAFAFNTVFIPVAAAGRLTPLAAMLLMLLSSAAVLLNSLRMRTLP